VQLFRDELRRKADAMVGAARTQSEHFTGEFQAAMRELSRESELNQRWMMGLLAVSLLLAWLLAHQFLGGHVLDRLQAVSRSLREDEGGTAVPVQGDDEIGEMARAVEQFQNDRRQLAQRTVQLEEANKELEAFAYSVSHDLRAPLRAIDGFSHILLDGYADKMDDEGKRLLGVVRGNVQRMAQLIDDILRFFRTGQQGMSFSRVDMGQLAREVIGELAAPDAAVQFEVEAMPTAQGDRAMLRQVLVNLLSNAIKFSRSRQPPRIRVGGHNRGGEMVYYVKDNGVGFDMRFAGKLFGVFQRLHGVEEFEGTGIGLAIVKRIIARHGAKVWAESRLNEGTNIYFSLPLAPQ
jgi:light-regulated signal transduction histidine kinase (bacteriophytochrome)